MGLECTMFDLQSFYSIYKLASDLLGIIVVETLKRWIPTLKF